MEEAAPVRVAEEAKDATISTPHIASVGLRRARRDDDSPFAALAFLDAGPGCGCWGPRPSDVLRRRCAAFIARSPWIFNEEVLGQAPASYAAWLSKVQLNKHRCGEAELVALSETLNLEIAVWSTLFDGGAPLLYKPRQPTLRAHLLFSGAHYDLIVAREVNGAVRTTFPIANGESDRAIRLRVSAAVRRWRKANGDCYWAHANDARHPPLLS